VQAYTVPILTEPPDTRLVQTVERGIIDNKEDLAPTVPLHKQSEEAPESLAAESLGELVREPRVFQVDSAEDMGRLAFSIGVDSGLLANSCPGLVESAIEPKACLVPEKENPSAGSCFFLMPGNVFLNHIPCRSRSARASLRLGRCTEKPSLCNSRGM
jgi:hypothetical protein